jgi:hypothetical protein
MCVFQFSLRVILTTILIPTEISHVTYIIFLRRRKSLYIEIGKMLVDTETSVTEINKNK